MDSTILIISIFLGIVAVISGMIISYSQKKKFLNEINLDIAKVENDIIENIRDIGLSNLKETPVGHELYSLLSERELILLAEDPSLLANSKNDSIPEKINGVSIYEASAISHLFLGLLNITGGIASILVLWLLIGARLEYSWTIYLFLFLGVVGSIFFSRFIDNYLDKTKLGRNQRILLSPITGAVGGWLGFLFVIFFIPALIYVIIARFLPTGNQKG